MAELRPPRLVFDDGCPDPGHREVDLPPPIPEVGDDFDWELRDFDGFRDELLRELALRFPERRRWTPADLEVVLVEALSAVLDQLSDTADRVATEAYLETARLPETVYTWLSFIGVELGDREALLSRWRDKPHEMEAMRRLGPGRIREQKRMASLSDYAARLEEHPLVERAQGSRRWSGAWPEVWVTVSLWDDRRLQDAIVEPAQLEAHRLLREAVDDFHGTRQLPAVDWQAAESFRDALEGYLERYRMIGQPAFLRDVRPVGVDLAFCLHLGQNYFHTEVLREARRTLGRGPGGFFEPGRLRFGEDLHRSDLIERLMGLDGVHNVEVLTFKKVGALYDNRAHDDALVLGPEEIARCDNDGRHRERGLLQLTLRGGRRG